jgi:hypothetical protein
MVAVRSGLGASSIAAGLADKTLDMALDFINKIVACRAQRPPKNVRWMLDVAERRVGQDPFFCRCRRAVAPIQACHSAGGVVCEARIEPTGQGQASHTSCSRAQLLLEACPCLWTQPGDVGSATNPNLAREFDLLPGVTQGSSSFTMAFPTWKYWLFLN